MVLYESISGAGWRSWTPTWGNFTKGSAVVSAEYAQIGKTIFGRIGVNLSGSTMGTNPIFSLPVTSVVIYNNLPIGQLYVEDNAVAGWTGVIAMNGTSTTTAILYLNKADSTYGKLGSITSTEPMTWGDSDFFTGQFIYEAA